MLIGWWLISHWHQYLTHTKVGDTELDVLSAARIVDAKGIKCSI